MKLISRKVRIVFIAIFIGLAVLAITLEHYNLVIGYGVLGQWLTTALITVAPELAGIAIGVITIDYLNEVRQNKQLLDQLIIQMRSHHDDVTDTAHRTLRAYGWLTDGSLRNVSLFEANLTKADLRKANLEGVNLHSAKLQKANLNDSNLQNACLQLAELQKAWLLRANLQNASLPYANLQGAQLSDTNLQGAFFGGSKTYISDSSGSHTRLNRTILNKANLANANLQDAHLFLADLREASLYKSNLKGAMLKEADLQGASLEGANLQDANLESANLKDTRMSGNLSVYVTPERTIRTKNGANLERADLSKADLQGAILEEVNLQYVNLEGANLKGAKLNEANFQGAQNYTYAQLLEAKTLKGAILPDGINFDEWSKQNKPDTKTILEKDTVKVIKQHVKVVSKMTGKSTKKIYSILRKQFNVSSYKDIQGERLKQVITFLENYQKGI